MKKHAPFLSWDTHLGVPEIANARYSMHYKITKIKVIKSGNICKFFSEFRWTDEIGSGIRNVYKYLNIYVPNAKPLFIEDDKFKTITQQIPKSPLWGYWGFRGNGGRQSEIGYSRNLEFVSSR